MTQFIELNEVKAACRAAYARGDLCAQSGMNLNAYRLLSGTGAVYHCAIGCALAPNTLREIEDQADLITSLRLQGIISYKDRDEDELKNIQYLHDNWAATSPSTPALLEARESSFQQAIQE